MLSGALSGEVCVTESFLTIVICQTHGRSRPACKSVERPCRSLTIGQCSVNIIIVSFGLSIVNDWLLHYELELKHKILKLYSVCLSAATCHLYRLFLHPHQHPPQTAALASAATWHLHKTFQATISHSYKEFPFPPVPPTHILTSPYFPLPLSLSVSFSNSLYPLPLFSRLSAVWWSAHIERLWFPSSLLFISPVWSVSWN